MVYGYKDKRIFLIFLQTVTDELLPYTFGLYQTSVLIIFYSFVQKVGSAYGMESWA